MSAYGSGKANDTDFRRKWDREEYAAKARARESRDRFAEENEERRKKGLPPLKPKKTEEENESKQKLSHRTERLELEKNVGKVQVIQSTDSRKQPGYYCKDCDITIKDSVTYIDHLNGRKHLANAGISRKTEKAGINDVKERLAALKRKRENPDEEKYDLDERLTALKQQEEEERKKRREKKKQKKESKKKEDKIEISEEGDEMAKMMGFAGFGSSKV
ncbi:hypothetical protein BY458DRAFT_507259 [Sporodiniella umbellata]|nr:hypothetical protein BY458DRAFT_507259 [Sporodiniella umbellata]